jgi:CRP/FNR family transcriptional regulator
LLQSTEVSRPAPIRRSTSLYQQGQQADSLYFIEEGLVKLTRNNESGDRIILAICGPGQLVGEEAISQEPAVYYSEAEVLTTTNVVKIPREVLEKAMASSYDLSASLVEYLLERKLSLAVKVELLCLHDVEYRILHYLAELTRLVQITPDSDGFQVPITQLELADLIGATRETTSTTLNQLERRGLVKLSRRLLTVPSPEKLREAAISTGDLPLGTTVGETTGAPA